MDLTWLVESLNLKPVCLHIVAVIEELILTIHSDEFATKLGHSAKLASALLKLQIQNLAAMDADWLYATYHYSHPILPERLGAMGWNGEKKVDKSTDGVVKAADREL